MRSGTEARTRPCSSAARFSFCSSSLISRPASSPRPSTTTEPRTKPLVVRRSTSEIFPVTRRNAPMSAIRASTGLSWAPATACPILIASETEPRTVASRAWLAVIVYSVDAAAPPNSTAAARASRSIQCPVIARKTIRLPRSSVITHGLTSMPANSIVTCGTSGNARPIPSASTTGSPMRVAQAIGSSPFDPPIPAALVAVPDLLDVHGRGADPPARHDQRVRRQVFDDDQRRRAEVLGGLQRLEQPDARVPAAAGPEDRAPAGQGTQRRRIQEPLHERQASREDQPRTDAFCIEISSFLCRMARFLMGAHSVGFVRFPCGDDLVPQIGTHQIRRSLARIAVAATGACDQPDQVSAPQPEPGYFAERAPDRDSAADDLDVVHRAVAAPGRAPRRCQVTAPGGGEQRLLRK